MKKSEVTVKNRVKDLWLKKQWELGREISRDELARELGVTRQTLNTWFENRITSFAADKVVAFCRYFGVSVGELLVIEDADEATR